MALLINNAKFKNTTVSAPQVYVRLQYVALADGKKTSVVLLTGLDKQSALTWNGIVTNLPEQFLLEMAENEIQDLLVIHNKVKSELEKEGFEVTIDLA
jgi:hypothetical protein